MRRHIASGKPLGKAFDHRRLADTSLAGKDRIVLTTPHQHVDDLADLIVTAKHRIHLAGCRGGGHVDGEAIERRCAARRRRVSACAGGAGRQAGAIHWAQVFFVRLAPDLARFRGENVVVDLPELRGDLLQRAAQLARLQRSDQQMAGADLRLAEEQGRVVPATIEQVGDLVGDTRHLGFVLAKPVDCALDVLEQFCAIELVVVDRE